MSDMILYHYALSPYSEKIRAMLGYAGMCWESVIVPEMPPRPQLDRLAGGYRRIPVAQIGADIFCDSRTIAAEIARISGNANLALETCDHEVQEFAGRADSEFILACFGTALGNRLVRKLLKTLSLLDFGRFMWDRIKMGRKSSLQQMSGKQAKAVTREYLERMEKMLQGDFLFGDDPNIADFSAYHGLWFIQDVAELNVIKNYPAVIGWMERIKAFGHGTRTEISAEQAIDIATGQQTRLLPTDNQDEEWMGQLVSISPSDYGKDPVKGVLVANSACSWILQRRVNGSSTVHVHFPKQGFTLEVVT
jgi:glutathione S-transferase